MFQTDAGAWHLQTIYSNLLTENLEWSSLRQPAKTSSFGKHEREMLKEQRRKNLNEKS